MRRRLGRASIAGAAALAVIAAMAVAPPATAVHNDGVFQLDYVTTPEAQGAANVSSTNISPAGNTGDDWDKVYDKTSGAFAATFIDDAVGDAETSFFDKGGSKDEEEISGAQKNWLWDDTNDVIPDKDDISAAFAAAYDAPDGRVHVYFGADRYDTNGSAEMGFWFFRDRVTLGTKPNFNGVHTVGDILVLVEFVNGGKVGNLTVYKWVGGNKPLTSIFDSTAADCATAPADDPVCGVINNIAGEDPPWDYMNKDGQSTYQTGALLEAGIDLTYFLGSDIGCFSSFMAETRSSHSIDAQLKDFALGEFPVCGIKVTKTGDTLSKVGDPVDYTMTVENTGRATLYKRNISDTLLGAIATDGTNVNPNGYILTNTCGASLAPKATCTITARRTVQPGDPDPLPNTVTVLYFEKYSGGVFSGQSFTSSDDHSVNLFQPAVKVDKTGDTLSKIGDDVKYTFTITNMSSADSPDLEFGKDGYVTDDVLGDLTALATSAGCDVLGKAEVCSFSVTRKVIETDGDPLKNTVKVLYHPVGFPNPIEASDGHSVNLFQPAVKIEKTGNALSKVGDPVTYKFTITNTSSGDSPNLVLDSIVDDVLGDLKSHAGGCTSLAPGGKCEFSVPWTVAAVDVNPVDEEPDDPVINTVIVQFHPDGFPNEIKATASHKLNLFQPAIAFEKTANTKLSKATDVVKYTLTLNGKSSPDTPDMSCLVTDPMLGVSETVTLTALGTWTKSYDYTVKTTDPDPLKNTAHVKCTFKDFPNILEKDASAEVNLFQPAVDIVKSGPPLSKLTDAVVYTFKITNKSSADSPNLVLKSIDDNVLGNLVADATAAGCADLAPGASCEFTKKWIVTEVDIDGDLKPDDPVVNTVNVVYSPVGFLNLITDKADHTLNLFQPSITFDKEGDTLSKVGDKVTYTLTLTNTSSSDSPDLDCTIKDTLIGVDKSVTLKSGAQNVTTQDYIVPEGASDPLVNEASVLCKPSGFPNELKAKAEWKVNLFQPKVEVKKEGPEYSKATDTASFKVTITNKSSADTPRLNLDYVKDSLVGDLTALAKANGCDPLVTSCTFSYDYKVPDPYAASTLTNKVAVRYHPAGFPNDIDGAAEYTTKIVHPAFSVTKECASKEPVDQGAAEATFKITYKNTGDADLVFTPADPNEGGTVEVPAGETKSVTVTVKGPFTGMAKVDNTVKGKVTLAAKYKLSNSYDYEAAASCRIGSRVNVLKLTKGVPADTAPPAWTFRIFTGPDGFDVGTELASDSTPPATLDFGNLNLDPEKAYTLCETNVPAGWTSTWWVDLDNNGSYEVQLTFDPNPAPLPGTLYNPNADDSTGQDLGNRCVEIGAGTPYKLPAGGTLKFQVDNTYPGGEPRTPGYWKNWSSCTGGGQYANATGANDPANEMWTLDEALNTSGGYMIGDRMLNGVFNDDDLPFASPSGGDCVEAVRLLDKSDASTGKKMASDAAYELATALLAARLNFTAGAKMCTVATDAATMGQALLDGIGFVGIGPYLPSKSKAVADMRAKALKLAYTLDQYNNGYICP